MKILLSILLFISLSAGATNYYVSFLATGSGDGRSQGAPWTFAQLNSGEGNVVTAGDIVSFRRGGTYSGQLNARGGTSLTNRITYNAYDAGTDPIISGFATLTSWTLHSGNIYYASLAVGDFQMGAVTLDGAPKAMGR